MLWDENVIPCRSRERYAVDSMWIAFAESSSDKGETPVPWTEWARCVRPAWTSERASSPDAARAERRSGSSDGALDAGVAQRC